MPPSDSKIKSNSKSFSSNSAIARQSLHAPQYSLSMKRKIPFAMMTITFHKTHLNKILYSKRQSLPTLPSKIRKVRLLSRLKMGLRIKRSVIWMGALMKSHREKLMRFSKNCPLRKKLRVTEKSNLQKIGNKHRLKLIKIKPK